MRGLPDEETGRYITVMPRGGGRASGRRYLNIITTGIGAENRQGTRGLATYRIVWMSRVLQKWEIRIAAGSACVVTQWSVVDVAISCVLAQAHDQAMQR